jgi:stage V sporulation protein G
MEITAVRVALREAPVRSPGPPSTARLAGAGGGEKRLKAYATLTFDHCFVVRNIKIIDGKSGLFVAMPSHKPKVTCTRCQYKHDVGGRYCSQCGNALLAGVAERPPGVARPGHPEAGGRTGEAADNPAHRDIAHPITMEFRQYLQQKVLAAYDAELAKARGGHPSGMAAGGDEAR